MGLEASFMSNTRRLPGVGVGCLPTIQGEVGAAYPVSGERKETPGLPEKTKGFSPVFTE